MGPSASPHRSPLHALCREDDYTFESKEGAQAQERVGAICFDMLEGEAPMRTLWCIQIFDLMQMRISRVVSPEEYVWVWIGVCSEGKTPVARRQPTIARHDMT